MSPFERAIKTAGSPSALAAALGETPQTINNWRIRRVPASKCTAVEAATGVPAAELRPDVFGDPKAA